MFFFCYFNHTYLEKKELSWWKKLKHLCLDTHSCCLETKQSEIVSELFANYTIDYEINWRVGYREEITDVKEIVVGCITLIGIDGGVFEQSDEQWWCPTDNKHQHNH